MLLHDLMKQGKLEVAQPLWVTHKTLAAALDSEVLTSRESDALEKILLALDDLHAHVDHRDGR